MKIDLKGRTAVITGGSRGLGEAMAKALAGERRADRAGGARPCASGAGARRHYR